MTLRIKDQDEDLDKLIMKIDLVEVKSTSLSVQVFFANTAAISQDIREPDTLIVKIALPWLFIDAETDEPLATEPIEFTMQLGMQYV